MHQQFQAAGGKMVKATLGLRSALILMLAGSVVPLQTLPQLPAQQHQLFKHQLFRHRFIAANDMVIRLPLDATQLLERFVAERHGVAESGCVHAQLEVLRPQIRWCRDSQRMLGMPNAGGSSLDSEALALEVLARAFGASLVKTETELTYQMPSKMTDMAVTVFGEKIGVSVTRAFKWCPENPGVTDMTGDEAQRLLLKKLEAIDSSSRNVRNMRWRKQLLHVWSRSYRDSLLFEREYEALPAELRSRSVLLITRIAFGGEFIW